MKFSQSESFKVNLSSACGPIEYLELINNKVLFNGKSTIGEKSFKKLTKKEKKSIIKFCMGLNRIPGIQLKVEIEKFKL